jgi:hypothetical protein
MTAMADLATRVTGLTEDSRIAPIAIILFILIIS